MASRRRLARGSWVPRGLTHARHLLRGRAAAGSIPSLAFVSATLAPRAALLLDADSYSHLARKPHRVMQKAPTLNFGYGCFSILFSDTLLPTTNQRRRLNAVYIICSPYFYFSFSSLLFTALWLSFRTLEAQALRCCCVLAGTKRGSLSQPASNSLGPSAASAGACMDSLPCSSGGGGCVLEQQQAQESDVLGWDDIPGFLQDMCR